MYVIWDRATGYVRVRVPTEYHAKVRGSRDTGIYRSHVSEIEGQSVEEEVDAD